MQITTLDTIGAEAPKSIGNHMADTISTLRRVLQQNKTIAVVGLSPSWHRPSYFAASYMQSHGYRIIPVNPRADEILGERCYPDLASIDQPVDMVDCFRRAEEMPALAAQAIALGAQSFWVQLGIKSPEAQLLCAEAGLDYVEDRCVKIEHARLFGGLGWCGVNTGVISARRPD